MNPKRNIACTICTGFCVLAWYLEALVNVDRKRKPKSNKDSESLSMQASC